MCSFLCTQALLDTGAFSAAACTDHLGRSPVHCAAVCNKVEAIKLLAKAGFSASAKDNSSKTPLHAACAAGAVQAAAALLELGASSAGQDAEGRQPLHHACLSKAPGELLSVKGLLPDKDSVNAADK